jgi:hypothetical protein
MRFGLWQRILVYGSLSVVALSGLMWWFLHDFISDEPDSLQRLLLVTHGVSAFAALVAFGSVLPMHVRAGWRDRKNLTTGLSVIAGMMVLSITALMLYYGGEESRFWVRWSHIGFGLLCLAVFPLHIVRGHRARISLYSPAGEPSEEHLSLAPAELSQRTQSPGFRRKITRAR